MTNDQIKKQIISKVSQFKENLGTFKSHEIIFHFVNFLKTEPYLKELLNDHFLYADEQIEIITDMVKNKPELLDGLKNITISPLVCPDFSALPAFSKDFGAHVQALEEHQPLPLTANLPIHLTCLKIVADSFQEIKDCQKSGDEERAKKIIEINKEESLSIVSFNINEKAHTLMTAQYMAMSMEIVGKYILDQIDSETFLNDSLPQAQISFDEDKSILSIYGEPILIRRKKDNPIDHYILEAIFAKEDLTEQTDFVEIAENYLGEEYDSEKDPSRFRHACDKLNGKISKDTDNKIIGFITYSTGKRGWCKINPKYL